MTEPTDAEILEAVKHLGAAMLSPVEVARAVLAKLGTPPVVAREPVAWGIFDSQGFYEAAHDQESAERFCAHYNKRKGADPLKPYTAGPLYTTPQPTQAQAGAAPLTEIRKAALDLYTPPFRHEYGYIRDANHQMVADDASSEATGLIASRIRGWGRIQYMDKPEMRANALQDEVAEIVAEALNAYWASHGIGIKGGQHGADQ